MIDFAFYSRFFSFFKCILKINLNLVILYYFNLPIRPEQRSSSSLLKGLTAGHGLVWQASADQWLSQGVCSCLLLFAGFTPIIILLIALFCGFKEIFFKNKLMTLKKYLKYFKFFWQCFWVITVRFPIISMNFNCHLYCYCH